MENSLRRIYRSGKDHVFGGVCAGLAEYFAIDVTLLRILWLVLTLVNGLGAVIYVVCLVLFPIDPEHQKLPPEERTRAGNTGLYVGIAIVIWGVMLMFNNMFRFFWWNFDWWFFRFPWMHWRIVWPILLILFGVWFIFRANDTGNNKSGTDDSQKKLFRRRSDKMIGGVCAGLAQYWNVDVTLVRVGYTLGTLFTAVWLGVVAYIVMLIVLPEEPLKKAAPAPVRKTGKKAAPSSKKGESHE